jgi:hypothetical protein
MNGEPIETSAIPDDLCSIYGCARCPGFARIGDLPPARMWAHGPVPDDSAVLVVCVHQCHQKSEKRLENLEAGGPAITITYPRCRATTMVPDGFATRALRLQRLSRTVEPLPPTVR